MKEVPVESEVLAQVRNLFAPEEGALAAARSRAPDRLGVPAPEVGALLRWAAVTCGARTAVEVGSAGGVSGLWLAPALGERGMLTSIEPDPHTQRLATTAYAEAGVEARIRAIHSEPSAVLPRLSDAAYDLVLLQGPVPGFPDALEHAIRLLHAGGLLLARGVLRPGDHADDLARFLDGLANEERLTATVLAIDGGIVLATRQEDPADEASPAP